MTTGLDNPAATGGAALLAALAIQYLKNSNWATWFSRETSRANLALSVLVSGAMAIGIHFSWDASTDTLAIIGLQGALRHGLWEWVLQWATQHAAYKTLVVPAEILGEIRAYLSRALPPPVTEAARKAVEGGVNASH